MWRLYRYRQKVQLWRLGRRGERSCAYCHCSFGRGKRARTVDHVIPVSRGGTWRLSNLVWACQACNQRKADRPLTDLLWSDWLKRRRELVAQERSAPARAAS